MRRFEWDPVKARTNRRKHGIDFEDATLVFDDPYLLTERDRREHGEQRWRSYGLVGPTIVVVTVAHTWEHENEDEIIRIISARKATPWERKKYAEARTKDLS